MVYLLRYNVHINVCNQKYTVLVKNLRTTTRITYKIHKKNSKSQQYQLSLYTVFIAFN